MWGTYKNETEKYNDAVISAQKDDANNVIVFVSWNPLILSSVDLTGFKDWSLLRSRCRVHCRKLQEAIPRLRRYDNGPSHADITAARWF